jgi:glutamine amidotransferase
MSASPVIAVIDYGMGNLRSVAKAVEAAGGAVRIVTHPAEADDASGLVLPGVGALADCVAALRSSGLDETVRTWIAADRPFLGVCLGLQALFEHSEEGDTPGLGIFPGRIVRFRLPAGLKVPHMGWNTVRFTQPGQPLTAGLATEGEAFYFVHSYYCVPQDPALVLAECEYGIRFTAAIARGRCQATQFHPEKSQAKGLRLYRNFVTLCAGAVPAGYAG